MIEKEYKAMITVEAALVVPLILFILSVFLQIGFFYMDQAKIYGICDLVASYASVSIDNKGNPVSGKYILAKRNSSLYEKDNNDVEKKIEALIQKQCQQKLLLLSLDTINVKLAGRQIKITVQGTAHSPVWRFFHFNGFTFQWEKVQEKGDYADFLRKKEVEKQLQKEALKTK